MGHTTPVFVMSIVIRIDKYSHGARLYGYDASVYAKLSHFLEGLALKEPRRLPRGGVVMELKKRFFGMTEDRREIFIHRNHVPALLTFLHGRGITQDRVDITEIPTPASATAMLELFPSIALRDYQEPIVDALSDNLYSRRLDLQTGKGKSLSALAAAANRKQRTVIMIPPKYFGIWIKALEETFVDIAGRYVTVSGSGELQQLIEMGVNGTLNHDVIMISMVTYRAYLESYEKFGNGIVNMGYLVPPPRFHEALGVGLQINDEIQEDPGLVFRIDVFTNVQKQIYLSATPYTGSEFVTRMIEVMVPSAETGCPLPEYDAYINAVGVLYNEPNIQPKDYLVPFKNVYNHARYETRMLKNPRRLSRYFDMQTRLVKRLYVEDRKPGQKLLILCATVEFIDALTKHLKQQFPALSVNKYVQGVSYKTILNSDITVSTIKSSGTGVDIPNLRELLLNHATDSKKDNLQILGRLRKLKDYGDVTPRMTYLVCQDIPQQVKYMNNKRGHFDGRVVNHRLLRF